MVTRLTRVILRNKIEFNLSKIHDTLDPGVWDAPLFLFIGNKSDLNIAILAPAKSKYLFKEGNLCRI